MAKYGTEMVISPKPRKEKRKRGDHGEDDPVPSRFLGRMHYSASHDSGSQLLSATPSPFTIDYRNYLSDYPDILTR